MHALVTWRHFARAVYAAHKWVDENIGSVLDTIRTRRGPNVDWDRDGMPELERVRAMMFDDALRATCRL